ncbi:MAG: YicC/YloC family endoribonuclease [Gemmatimonadota bacterium]
MIRSMTGYGEAECETPVGVLRAEAKTVNHRHLNTSIRLPTGLDALEPVVQACLKEAVRRGYVNLVVRLESAEATEDGRAPLRLNEERARQYLAVLTELKEKLELPGEVDVALLSRFGDLIEPDSPDAVEVDEDDIRSVVTGALAGVVAMREEEGRKLAADLAKRLEAIEASLGAIDERAPARLEKERARLRGAAAELLEDASRVDESRLAQEIAYLADKWDVGEERMRLRAHIEAFRDFIAAESAEPVGKRLGFLVQEMHRETNTIGAKANDAAMEHEVVAIKNELERLREQIENVE